MNAKAWHSVRRPAATRNKQNNTMNYLYRDPSDPAIVKGPVPLTELERLKAVGTLHDGSPICAEGMQAWGRLDEVLVAASSPDPAPPEQTEELIPGWNDPRWTNCIGGGL